ncbi:unnamed protein product [Clonostachys rosea f. rosea IK726]|uniref:Transcription initiation factor IIF subunit beta n=2 Tax=Bionectria ochroleuca TaxID=29856 RepID=A0A0B7JXF0_BIOOC|nr:unnamed protein product [Clonostachys rosea f. rosea IK726]
MADAAHVKPEPDADSSAAINAPAYDDDLYEDAGDLEFYGDSGVELNSENLYLARVPKYIWDAWMKMTERLGDDDEIQIGTMRSWVEEQPNGGSQNKLRLLLHKDQPEHQLLPREYDVELLESQVKNHYIFSERDLESYKAKNKARTEAANAGIPMSALRAKEGGGQKPHYDRRNRFQPYYRKAIPKKTKITGKINYDVRLEPRDKTEETRLLAQRLLEADTKAGVRVISRNKASAIINPGIAGSAGWGNNFIKNAAPTVKPKKAEVVKNARLPKNQLLDLIFDCFRQYQYWSMKALRQRTQQPEAWLRQVVDEVAVLIKSGSFANHYTLSDAYRDKAGSESKEEAAAAEEDDDDDDEEMEDILPA